MSVGDALLQDMVAALNEQQQRAVRTTKGPLLVMAGAGSGKTRVLTHRVGYIVASQLAPPWSVLCITFTNKAAAEMRHRIHALLPGQMSGVWVHTFHGLCARILRTDIQHLGYDPTFTILDTNDQISLLRSLLVKENLDVQKYPPRLFRAIISTAKNGGLTPHKMLDQARGAQDERAARIYHSYEKAMRAQQSLDFDDLMLMGLRLLEEVPSVRERYAKKFRYVHVDEYQDTNMLQYRLLRILTAVHRNLCVVGDMDQSIYRFRGADRRNVSQLRGDFPDLTMVTLEQNYRSTKVILQAANELIAHNPEREKKVLWTENPKGEKIRVYEARNEREEAAYIVNVINEAHKRGVPYSHHAVLYRTNAQARTIEETFLQACIPYRVWGGMRFYDRREIKDVLAYLRLLLRPQDDVSFSRVVNVPRRGVGGVTLERLRTKAAELGCSLWEALSHGMDKSKGLQSFFKIMEKLISSMNSYNLPELIDAVLESTGYLTWIEQQEKEKAEDRIAYLDEFRSLAANFDADYVETSGSGGIRERLLVFLTDVALLTDLDQDSEESSPANDVVQMMTLHSAKGLEFPCVFLVGMEEENIPHIRALTEDPSEGLWEERRLIYVALTRAQETLHLVHANVRTQFAETLRRIPSRFLQELPEDLLVHEKTLWETSTTVPSKRNRFVASPAPASLVLMRGDVVEHASWGDGKVVNVDEKGDSVVIRFPKPVGERRLLLSYAPLVKK
ncbi:ATP-dependent helicase [Pasteuria penetrans]|uniref:ATP-dependent helicase n=1 Tax=Pasteuria penetrans TaxID=86005 RepID=UPI000FBDF58B|nr:UvrD-helicase domain-containing protein [Pasteuria penetrans]